MGTYHIPLIETNNGFSMHALEEKQFVVVYAGADGAKVIVKDNVHKVLYVKIVEEANAERETASEQGSAGEGTY